MKTEEIDKRLQETRELIREAKRQRIMGFFFTFVAVLLGWLLAGGIIRLLETACAS